MRVRREGCGYAERVQHAHLLLARARRVVREHRAARGEQALSLAGPEGGRAAGRPAARAVMVAAHARGVIALASASQGDAPGALCAAGAGWRELLLARTDHRYKRTRHRMAADTCAMTGLD